MVEKTEPTKWRCSSTLRPAHGFANRGELAAKTVLKPDSRDCSIKMFLGRRGTASNVCSATRASPGLRTRDPFAVLARRSVRDKVGAVRAEEVSPRHRVRLHSMTKA